jgi:hypothetical protein
VLVLQDGPQGLELPLGGSLTVEAIVANQRRMLVTVREREQDLYGVEQAIADVKALLRS